MRSSKPSEPSKPCPRCPFLFGSAPLHQRFGPSSSQGTPLVRQNVLGDYYVRLHVDEDNAVVRILQVQPARAEDRPDLVLPDKLPPRG